jgi:hypothetical protein
MFRNNSFFLLLFIGAFFLGGCKKDYERPIIQLIPGTGLFYTDTLADPGQLFSIRIRGNSGSSPATNFRISVETNGVTGTVLDSGIYSEDINLTKSFYFGGNNTEKWTFYVKNKEGIVAAQSISIRRNPNALYGPVVEYPNLILKMQENNGGNMMVLSTGEVIPGASSVSYQTTVDFLAYYSTINYYTLSSPNETEAPGFYPSILSMTTKNEIRYKDIYTEVSPAAYDAVMNDSLILASYDNSVIGKRKAKNVIAGNVIPFAVQTGPMAGKKGLIKIMDTQGEANGTITLSIKIQQQSKHAH